MQIFFYLSYFFKWDVFVAKEFLFKVNVALLSWWDWYFQGGSRGFSLILGRKCSVAIWFYGRRWSRKITARELIWRGINAIELDTSEWDICYTFWSAGLWFMVCVNSAWVREGRFFTIVLGRNKLDLWIVVVVNLIRLIYAMWMLVYSVLWRFHLSIASRSK